MRKIAKKFLQYYLKVLAKLFLFINKPTVIAIAGSTNKAFFKDEIERVLNESGLSVRSNKNDFNTEIGLPLAILDLPSGYNSYKEWLPIIFKALASVFYPNSAKYLVLELGVSDAGDMEYLLSIIKPEIAVITDVTQRYLESFGSMDELASEYELLARSIGKNGHLLLNYDNGRVREMAGGSKAQADFFGLSREAGWNAELVAKTDNGQEVIFRNGIDEKKYFINRHGEHHIYAFLAGQIIKNHVVHA